MKEEFIEKVKSEHVGEWIGLEEEKGYDFLFWRYIIKPIIRQKIKKR